MGEFQRTLWFKFSENYGQIPLFSWYICLSRTLLLQKQREKQELDVTYELVLKRCLMSCVCAHANGSCFRLRMHFRHNQFDLPCCLLSSGRCSCPMCSGGFGSGCGGSRLVPAAVTVIAAWSWVPALSPNFAAGTWGPRGTFLWALCLSLKDTYTSSCQGLSIYPMLHDDHPSFLKRRLGRAFWSLAGMFCKLPLGSILKSIKAALAVSWHSPRGLWH